MDNFRLSQIIIAFSTVAQFCTPSTKFLHISSNACIIISTNLDV